MDSRGEAIARGASEADHRQPRGTAVELRDEGRPASSVGHGGHTVSRRFGVAPPGIDTTQILETGLDARVRKRRSDSFLAVDGDDAAPPAGAAGDDLLHLLSDAASAEIALLDHRGVVISVNAAWRQTASRTGHTASGLGHRFVHVCRWISPHLDARVVDDGIADLLSGAAQSFVQTSERMGPDGACWRRLRVARLRVGADVHFVAVHEDLTQIMRAQTALQDATEQLLSAQEDERHRIAVELHDSTSQHLVAVGIGLANLRQLTAKKVSTQDVIEDMSRSLKEAMKEIRVLSYLMNPPSMMREGLVTHARRFVRGFGARTGLQTRFIALGPLQAFDAQVQHTVFRVIQEALANVYKHAQATKVSVSVVSRRSGLEVCIADDGHGIHGLFEGGRIEDVPLGVGIAGMRSRMAQLGGQLTIESGEHGTNVTGQLPPARKRAAPRPPAREPAGDLGILQPASPGFT